MELLQEEILEVCERYRDQLPGEFFYGLDELVAGLLAGVLPGGPRMRGADAPLGARLRRAAVAELHKLLCTNERRYKEVRQEGHTLSKAAVAATAGYVAGTLDVSIGLATAAVGFVALAILKVGIGVFCRVVPPEIS